MFLVKTRRVSALIPTYNTRAQRCISKNTVARPRFVLFLSGIHEENSVCFFLQTEFWYYPTDCINIPVLLLASESVPAFLNSSVEDASVTVKTVLPLSVPAFVSVDAV